MAVPVNRYRLPCCRNPKCGDVLERRVFVPLCPSCRLIGKVGLAVGALVAGILMKVFA